MWRRVVFVSLVLLGLVLLMWLSQVIEGDGFRVYVLTYIPVTKPAMAALNVLPEKIDAFEVCEGLYSGIPLAGLRVGSTVIFNHSGTSLRVFEAAGGFVFDTLTVLSPWDEWQGGTMQAGQLMQVYVLKTGGFPDTIEFERRIVHKQGLFVTGYSFMYRQWFRGYPGLGYGGLRITLGNGHLAYMLRSLRSVDGEQLPAKDVISAREALRVAAKFIQTCARSSTRFYVHGVRLGYFTLWPEVTQETLEPVWEIRFTGHTVYINAHSGEIMFGDGSHYIAPKTEGFSGVNVEML